MSFGKKAVAGLLVFGAVAGGVGAQTPAPVIKTPAAAAGVAVKPAGAAGAGTAAQRAKASLEPLLQQGMDALAAGQYQPARAAFLDAIAIDPRNVKAHHGLALCMVAQKEVAKAQGVLDKALTFTTTPDRALVINAIACNMATHMHMRAAKLAKDYLAAHPKEQDEPMLNALGTALSAATAAERKNRFFSECTSFYVIANQRLESARPGYKRFGAEWYTADQADAKTKALAAQQKKLDALSDAIATAEERMQPAAKELAHQQFLLTRGEAPGNYYIERAQAAYDSAQAAVTAAQEKYDALLDSLQTPKFPTEVAMVSMDAVTAPPITPATVVASVDPPKIEFKPKPKRV
jgi:hypothetical protein